MLIHPADNVEVHPEDGHKYALRHIRKGENIIKYGCPIGHATADIPIGAHVHTHNVRTNLSGQLSYTYRPVRHALPHAEKPQSFMGYVREDGGAGIRNDVWIVNTVGCVNKTAELLAARTGAKAFAHPFGCSQLGDDQRITQQVLKGLVNHPNAGGVLVLGLGCENNNIDVFKKVLGDYNPNRVKFLNAQDVEDELEAGTALIAPAAAVCGRLSAAGAALFRTEGRPKVRRQRRLQRHYGQSAGRTVFRLRHQHGRQHRFNRGAGNVRRGAPFDGTV